MKIEQLTEIENNSLLDGILTQAEHYINTCDRVKLECCGYGLTQTVNKKIIWVYDNDKKIPLLVRDDIRNLLALSDRAISIEIPLEHNTNYVIAEMETLLFTIRRMYEIAECGKYEIIRYR